MSATVHLVATYLYMFLLDFIFSISGAVFIFLVLFFPYKWRKERNKSANKTNNFKPNIIWMPTSIVCLLYLSIEKYCDGPGCNEIQMDYLINYFFVVGLLSFIGFYLTKRLRAGNKLHGHPH